MIAYIILACGVLVFFGSAVAAVIAQDAELVWLMMPGALMIAYSWAWIGGR